MLFCQSWASKSVQPLRRTLQPLTVPAASLIHTPQQSAAPQPSQSSLAATYCQPPAPSISQAVMSTRPMPSLAAHTPYSFLERTEQTYRGTRPSILNFSSKDPGEFMYLKISLTKLLSADANELSPEVGGSKVDCRLLLPAPPHCTAIQ